mmetsp:Transcript_33259/g.67865  ORF Transcript_33259/g.67865 Transcript_33259/m.67865 type:complete len:105 (-) Transcript_33259:74-388(-)
MPRPRHELVDPLSNRVCPSLDAAARGAGFMAAGRREWKLSPKLQQQHQEDLSGGGGFNGLNRCSFTDACACAPSGPVARSGWDVGEIGDGLDIGALLTATVGGP